MLENKLIKDEGRAMAFLGSWERAHEVLCEACLWAEGIQFFPWITLRSQAPPTSQLSVK